MSTQHGKSAAAHHRSSRHDDIITSGCNQTDSYQGDAAAAPATAISREKSTTGTYSRISQSWSQRVRSYRRASKRMISRDWFDQAVVGLILVNCIFLALDDPTMEASIYIRSTYLVRYTWQSFWCTIQNLSLLRRYTLYECTTVRTRLAVRRLYAPQVNVYRYVRREHRSVANNTAPW